MYHSLLNDIFGASPAINDGYSLAVKIGMDKFLIPAFFHTHFLLWWPYRFSGIMRKNNNNYYCYWEPSSQFRV